MSYIYKLFFITVITMCSYVAIAKDTVNLAIDTWYPPYIYDDGADKAAGLYADIINEVGKTMPNYKIVMKAYPWKRALIQAERGNALGVVPPYIKLSRTYIDPYSDPLFTEKVILLCNSKANIKGKKNWPKDFAGMKIGNTRGYLSAGKEFFEMVKKKEISNVEANSIDSALRMLIKNRTSCYVNARLAIDKAIKDLKLENIKLVEALVLSSNTAHIGYAAKPKGNLSKIKANFVAEFNAGLKQIKANGKYDKIIDKYVIKK